MKLASKGVQMWLHGAIESTNAEKFGEAGLRFLRVLEIVEMQPNRVVRSSDLGILAGFCSTAGHPDIALMALQGALESGEGKDHPERYCANLLTLANTWRTLGRPSASAAVNKAALSYALKHRRFGDAASASTNLAIIDANEGRLSDALKRLQRSLDLLAQDSHPDTEAITRLTLIQVVDALQADPVIALDAASDLFTRLKSHVGPERWNPVAQVFNRLVERYVASHPDLDADAWKRMRFPFVFRERRQ